MKLKRRLYGFKWRRLPTGDRGPDCQIIIRALMHYFWLFMFHATPPDWQLERSGKIRNFIGLTSLLWFGWWAYSHLRYRGYSKLDWERCWRA